ncbi:MAG: hypothetical protein U0R79_11280 [Propionicimonas sp.]
MSPQRTLVVSFASDDTGEMVDLDAFARQVGDSIVQRTADGWRLISSSVVTLRQVGTMGNMMFQSGGQYATQLGAVIVFQRDA